MAYCRSTLGPVFILASSCIVTSCLALCWLAYGQVANPEREIHVHDLPSLSARSTHASDVLAASLEIVFNDKEVCCVKNSVLEDTVQSCDPKSLKDIGSKLQGKHLLSDGRVVTVTAQYLTPVEVNAEHLFYMLAANHAPLMAWNSHLYIVNGMSYVESGDNVNGVSYVTHKFFLDDTRFSDSRREVSFDRLTDDAGKVQGLLLLWAALQ